ncbi:MAG: SPW repeat protein [Betaproteobacteria bacterium]|nr:SPW repeat protein [Betaproteobacteria bacterium]
MPKAWEEGVNMALGVWLIISPWVLGFASHRNATAGAVIVGVLVTLLAALAMAHDKGFEKWWDDHHVAP